MPSSELDPFEGLEVTVSSSSGGSSSRADGLGEQGSLGSSGGVGESLELDFPVMSPGIETTGRQSDNLPFTMRAFVQTLQDDDPQKAVRYLSENNIPAFLMDDGNIGILNKDGKSVGLIEADGFDTSSVSNFFGEFGADILDATDEAAELGLFAMAVRDPIFGQSLKNQALGVVKNTIRNTVAQTGLNAVEQGIEAYVDPNINTFDFEEATRAAMNGATQAALGGLIEFGADRLVFGTLKALNRGMARALGGSDEAVLQSGVGAPGAEAVKNETFISMRELIENHGASPKADLRSFIKQGLSRHGGKDPITGKVYKGELAQGMKTSIRTLDKAISKADSPLSQFRISAKTIKHKLKQRAKKKKLDNRSDKATVDAIDKELTTALSRVDDATVDGFITHKALRRHRSELDNIKSSEWNRETGNRTPRGTAVTSLANVLRGFENNNVSAIRAKALEGGQLEVAEAATNYLKAKSEFHHWSNILPRLARDSAQLNKSSKATEVGLLPPKFKRKLNAAGPSEEFFAQGMAAKALRGEAGSSLGQSILRTVDGTQGLSGAIATSIPLAAGIPGVIARKAQEVLSNPEGTASLVVRALESQIPIDEAQAVGSEILKAAATQSEGAVDSVMSAVVTTYGDMLSDVIAPSQSGAKSEWGGKVAPQEVMPIYEMVQRNVKDGVISRKQAGAILERLISRGEIKQIPKKALK